ncbi:GntR family transcriptional regulator [Rubellimicrobium arenae]|uniref:GntR family transcriptional regulator n=1 Tax=Rubellimicrobium arenae TaxID=2817372 RepID=UPI001B315A54|nr:GntR family transcriptional regulator [Rubellimicrobium arenae]
MKERAVPKADQIYEFLRRAIVRLEVEPGAAISEKDISAEFGVSRTPVREAIQRLADEDLINIFPHSGTYVSRISFKVAEEGFVIRRALEIESVRRAVQRIDDGQVAHLKATIQRMRRILEEDRLSDYLEEDDILHFGVAQASGFPRIWKFISLAKVHLDRMRQLSAPVPGHLADVTEQHAAIVAALERRNADQAELAMRIHLDSSFAVMAGMYEDKVNLFKDKDA